MSPRISARSTRSWACMALLCAAGATAGAACPSWEGTPVLQPIIPCDSHGTNQDAFNKLAWQQFIALNWAADPAMPGRPNPAVAAAAFGQAGTTPVVWETFKEASEVFRPGGLAPLPWSAPQRAPGAMLKAAPRLGVKSLSVVSKFSSNDADALHEIAEAGTAGAWLTAQPRMNNYLTLFEKRINQDEYNYINRNKLYIGNNQAGFAIKQGINLPDGSATFSSYGTVGAIEIKAGWIQLDDPTLWPSFKTSQAYVSYPGDSAPRLVTVGLVALHIIRKTPNAQQFVWSTFEHVNNAPSQNDPVPPPKPWYTFNNPSCNPQTDYYKCVPNKPPQACLDGAAGCVKDPYTAPVQVVRLTPISNTTTNNIVALNQQTWATIQKANSASVFLNYQLVNVLWPNNNTPINPGATVNLTDGDATPPMAQQAVANSVLETYHQSLNCLKCHVGAPIAGNQATLASDYSFLFNNASNPPAKPGKAASKPGSASR